MTNKTIKIIGIICISILFLFIFNTYSNAASFSASISKTSVTIGDTFTVTVKANNAAGMYKVSTSNSNVTVTAGNTSEFLENGSTTITFKATKAGSVTITAQATDMTDLDDDTKAIKGTKTFNVTIKEKTSNTTGNTKPNTTTKPNTGTTTTTTKSSNANLSNLGINPNDFSGFRSSITSYSVTVPKNVSSVSIYATAQDSKATISGTGSKSLNIGTNTFKVTVKAEDGTTKTYTLNITRSEEEEPEKSKDATLKSLSIEEGTISPKFDKKTKEYTLTVENAITEINISAETNDENAKYLISKNATKLKVGENNVEIVVIAEDETENKYIITVTREKASLVLQKIKVTYIDEKEILNILTLTPEFQEDVFEYDLGTIPHTVDKIDIEAISNFEDATISITGNENLKTGKNTITIVATLKAEKETEKDEVIKYTLTVEKEEEPVVIPPTIMGRIQNKIDGIMGWFRENTGRSSAIAFIICSGVIFILAFCMIADYRKYKLIAEKIAELTEINQTTIQESSNTTSTYEKNNEVNNLGIEEVTTKTKGRRFK